MKNNQTLKIKRPSYVIAETSKAQKSVLNILTDMGYRWANKIKANEFIPIEENERMDVINIYPSNLLLTMSPQEYLDEVKHKKTEIKISDFKPRVILWKRNIYGELKYLSEFDTEEITYEELLRHSKKVIIWKQSKQKPKKSKSKCWKS